MKPNIQNILLGMIVIVLMIIAIILVTRPVQAPSVPMYYDDSSLNNTTTSGAANAQNTTPQTTLSNPTITTPSSTASGPEWEKLTSADFIKIIGNQVPDFYYDKSARLSLSTTVDLTGDGIPEALVMGNGGNSIVTFILKKNTDGSIALLKLKDRSGVINPVYLEQIGRISASVGFELLPLEHGFYTSSLSRTGMNDYSAGFFQCDDNGVNAYVWNSSTKLFEWNQSLTSKYTLQVCK